MEHTEMLEEHLYMVVGYFSTFVVLRIMLYVIIDSPAL